MGCRESTLGHSYQHQTDEGQIQQPKVFKEDGIGPMIYVENLPRNISVSRLENEFNQFGNIKPGKIQIMNEGPSATAFIEFESRDSVAKAIQGSPLLICNRLVFVRV